MTVEEKLERLTERHEALAQSLELLNHSVHVQGDNIRKQGEHIDRILTMVEAQTTEIKTLMAATQALFQTATSHERRLQRLEGEAS